MYYKITFQNGTKVLLSANSNIDAISKAKDAIKKEGYSGYTDKIKVEESTKTLYDAYHNNEYDKRKHYAIIEY